MIIGGFTGLVVMFLIMMSHVMAPSPWLFLWPSCVFGFAYNGQGGLDGLLVWSLEIGGQFVIYAVIGWGVGSLLRIIRREY